MKKKIMTIALALSLAIVGVAGAVCASPLFAITLYTSPRL